MCMRGSASTTRRLQAALQPAANLEQFMRRRDFLKLGGLAAIQASAATRLAAQQMPHAPATPPNSAAQNLPKGRLHAANRAAGAELAPNLVISTTGYNDMSPGPVLRACAKFTP